MFTKFFSSYRLVLPNFRSLFYSTELAEIVDGEGQICKPKRIKVILLDAFSKNPLSLAESPQKREGVRASRKGPKTVDEHFANGSVSFLPPSTSPPCLLLFTLLFPSVSRWKLWFTTDISLSLSPFSIYRVLIYSQNDLCIIFFFFSIYNKKFILLLLNCKSQIKLNWFQIFHLCNYRVIINTRLKNQF